MKLATAVLQAGLEYAGAANALEWAEFRVTDWSFSSEKYVEVEFQNHETLKKKRVRFRIFQGHPGPNDKGLFWCAHIEKFVEVPEVGE